MLPGIRRTRFAAFGLCALLSACGASPPPQGERQLSDLPAAANLAAASGPAAPNGRSYPLVPAQAKALGEQLAQVETALQGLPANASDAELDPLAHRQQVLYRNWARQPAWDAEVIATLPAKLRPAAQLQLQARREFLAMHSQSAAPKQLPAWLIAPPAPLATLESAYRKAEKDTGIDWATLAAINLVETGMGRLQGLSVAGARGPMQFLPSTWAEAGIGKGSIDNPADAIAAAGRYLVRRGGRSDLAKAIWGYNNSWHYVRAVQNYASLMRQEPRRLREFHAWQIHFATPNGDLWLPEGYEQRQPLAIATYLQQAPWSAPPAR